MAVIREGAARTWKPEYRHAAHRKGLRYDSDITDEGWALVVRPSVAARRAHQSGLCSIAQGRDSLFHARIAVDLPYLGGNVALPDVISSALTFKRSDPRLTY